MPSKPDNNAGDADNPTPKKTRKRRQGQRPNAEEKRQAQARFLLVFSQTANVTAACEAAGIHRDTFYQWQEHDEAFGLKYHQAEAVANDRIRAEIVRRAVEGVEEPLVSMGRVVVVEDESGVKRPMTVRKYSDTLLIFHAKARMPEYRDKVQADINVAGSVTHDLNIASDPEAANIARAFIRRLSALGAGDAGRPGVPGE